MYKENASCSRLQTVPCSGRWGKKGCFFAFLIFLKGKFVFLFFSFIPLEVFLLGGWGGIDDGDGNTRRSGRNEIRERKRFLSLFRFFFPPPLSFSFWLSSLETSRPSTRAAADGNELERARYPAERPRRELEEEREREREQGNEGERAEPGTEEEEEGAAEKTSDVIFFEFLFIPSQRKAFVGLKQRAVAALQKKKNSRRPRPRRHPRSPRS